MGQRYGPHELFFGFVLHPVLTLGIAKQISFFCICVALTLRLLHQVSRMFGEDEFSGNPMDLCMQVLQFADNLERAYGELKSDGAIIPPDAVERMRQAEKECEKSPRK
jgi:hypothetical protein